MSTGEAAYLALVIFAMCSFVGCVGFVSWWSRRPAQVQKTAAAVQPVQETFRKAA